MKPVFNIDPTLLEALGYTKATVGTRTEWRHSEFPSMFFYERPEVKLEDVIRWYRSHVEERAVKKLRVDMQRSFLDALGIEVKSEYDDSGWATRTYLSVEN